MAKASLKFSGGKSLGPYLRDLASKMSKGSVRVGFLEGATYPSAPGKKTLTVAQVAFWNNFGTSRAPARPFFSNTIAEQSPTWGKKLAAIAKATNYDTKRTLALMGENIKDDIVRSIVDWPRDNAESTEQRKGFNKGLIDQGIMQRAVDYEVTV